MSKQPYTVILLRPDYLASDFGHDTYVAQVTAPDMGAAQQAAQEQAWRADGQDAEFIADYHPLATFLGHPEVTTGPVRRV